MYHGIINIYKEKGYTSHDVVAKLRGILHQKKIGHTGTLDPDAEGVLPVCLGTATKLCEMLTEKEKVYEAVLLLGKETDTQDISGTVLSEFPVTVSEETVEEAVQSFLGEYWQVPPMYSALKINGKKLYELAREGKTVERQARKVTLYEIAVLDMQLPRVWLRVRCSKGTYIRTLCSDIGEKLGCKGCMERLTRTRVSEFFIEDALPLDRVEQLEADGKLNTHILAVDQILKAYPAVTVQKEFCKLLYNGNSFALEDEKLEYSEQNLIRVYDWKGKFTALYSYCAGICYPVKMFLE